MNVSRGLLNLPVFSEGCVVTFGNFDSVHRGHQLLISTLTDAAHKAHLPTCVIVFEPQPEEFFRPYDCPSRLTRLREKLELFQQMKVDHICVLPFNHHVALFSAHEFLIDILILRLRAKQIVVGEDCRFGANHQGNISFLRHEAGEHGIGVTVVETLCMSIKTKDSRKDSDYRVSSTAIRQALQEGDLLLAAQLLGRLYGMSGRVAHGDKRARQLGFPTANIYVHRKKSPLMGVYLIKTRGLDQAEYYGIANIGYRPTAKKHENEFQKLLLEVHLFNFNQDIYGKHLCIEFIRKIRDERRFDSFEALQAQVSQDILDAKQMTR